MDFLLILLVLILVNVYLFPFLKATFEGVNEKTLWLLFLYHIFLTLVYIAYANYTTSDSFAYYKKTALQENWFEDLKTGTSFIRFLAWPFINIFKISYYGVMTIFSYLGFCGIALFLCVSRENNCNQNVQTKSLPFYEWVFFLPNIHFWSSSLGKGSVMTFSIALFIVGLSRFNRRFIPIIFGSLIIYMIRPHIMIAILSGVILGILIKNKGILPFYKFLLITVALIAVVFLINPVIEFTEVDSINILESNKLAHRVNELGKASSGLNMANYSTIEKVLTFWFRPLFIDAIGIMGFFSSIENLIHLFLFFKISTSLYSKSTSLNGFFVCCFFIFLLSSILLAQVSGNLGIALRQKAQVFPLIYLIYIKYRQKRTK